MSPIRLLLSLGLASCLGLATLTALLWEAHASSPDQATPAAQSKKGPNVQEPPKGVKDSAKTKAVLDLELAARLLQYGRSEKNAEALLLAAQILHKNPTEKLGVGHKVEGGDKEAKGGPETVVDDSPKALIEEAKKLSDSPTVKAMAEATGKIVSVSSRGAQGGPKVDSFTIQAGQTINWDPITFWGGEKAIVFIDHRIFGSCILEVRDDYGNVVARDTVLDTFSVVSFYPAFTGQFRIRFINTDSIAFNCALATN